MSEKISLDSSVFFYMFNTGLALSFTIEGHYKCRNNILNTMRFDDY